MTKSVQTGYLAPIFYADRFQRQVQKALDVALKIVDKHPFDAIAFTGTSGSALAYILGHTLNVPLICIRKPSESSHYWSNDTPEGKLEGFLLSKSFIIVDDFISSGKTVDSILCVMRKKCPYAKCVAAMMYTQSTEVYDYTPRNEYGDKMGFAIPCYSARIPDPND